MHGSMIGPLSKPPAGAVSCWALSRARKRERSDAGGRHLDAVVLWSHGLPVTCVACCVAYNCLARCQPLNAHGTTVPLTLSEGLVVTRQYRNA